MAGVDGGIYWITRDGRRILTAAGGRNVILLSEQSGRRVATPSRTGAVSGFRPGAAPSPASPAGGGRERIVPHAPELSSEFPSAELTGNYLDRGGLKESLHQPLCDISRLLSLSKGLYQVTCRAVRVAGRCRVPGARGRLTADRPSGVPGTCLAGCGGRRTRRAAWRRPTGEDDIARRRAPRAVTRGVPGPRTSRWHGHPAEADRRCALVDLGRQSRQRDAHRYPG